MASRPDKGHGRRENRTLESTTSLNVFVRQLGWTSVQQVFRLTRQRTSRDRATGREKTTVEVSYGITDLTRTQANAYDLLDHTRNHWGIETKLHWVLDVSYREDENRSRKDYTAENLAWIRRATASMVAQHDSPGGVNCKRKRAGWDDEVLVEIAGNAIA